MTASFDHGDARGQAQPPPGYLPPPSYLPPPLGYVPPLPGFPPPVGQYPGGYGPVAAPWGYHPVTGEPLSDKSKTVAGLLQLLGIIGILGVGRMYKGDTALGVVQLIVGLVFFCIGVPMVWGIIDAIVLMTGSPRDAYGRLLRDGA